MNVVTRSALPALVAASLLASSAPVAFASSGAPQPGTGSAAVAQEAEAQRHPLTPEQICARVAQAPRPHPVLSVLCRLYADPTLPADAKQQVGKAIVALVEHRLDRRDDRRNGRGESPRLPRVRPAATATPAN